MAEGREAASLGGFYQQLSAEQRQQIKAVALDMSAPYVRATIDHLPEGQDKIVFDRFHIMKMVNEALDRLRQVENQALSRAGDERLNRTRHLWLWSKLPASDQLRRVRGTQQQEHDHQTQGRRLPKHRIQAVLFYCGKLDLYPR